MVGAGSFGSRDAPLAPYEAFHPAPPPPRSQSLRLGDQSGPSPAFSLSGELPGDIIGLADDILFANPFAEAAGRHIGPRAQPLDPPLPLSTAQLCCLPGAQDRRVKVSCSTCPKMPASWMFSWKCCQVLHRKHSRFVGLKCWVRAAY